MTRSQRWILTLAAMAAFMTALDTLVVTTALSTIRADLGASVEQLEWTVNAYNLSFAVLLMTAAALGDRHGRRRVFAGGIGLFALASAACALAPSVGALIAARAVQGAGAATVTTLALALVSGGVLGVVWGLVRANRAGWDSAEVLGALAGGLGLVAAFVAWELRARAPMLPMGFFRSRAFSAGNLSIFCAVGSLFGAV